MRNECRAEYFGYISSCQLPVFGRPSHGGWIICLLHFSAVASSHWVGNEKRQFQMPVFASFIFVIIIYCLSLTVSVFSPVVPLFVSKPEIVKCLFFLFLRLLWPRCSDFYFSCCHGVMREHKTQRDRYSHDDRICPCVLLLFFWFFLIVVLHMNFSMHVLLFTLHVCVVVFVLSLKFSQI